MAIHLTHLGERLVEAMARADLERFYQRCGLQRYPAADWELSTELKLARWAGRAFDPLSRVDLGIRTGDSEVTPVEIKLGLSGLGKSRVEEMLRSWSESSHPDGRWSGSMMAILDRRFPALPQGTMPDRLQVIVDSRHYELTENWILIARRKVIAALQAKFLFRNARCVVFEDLAEDLGPGAFNRAVSSLLPGDFYQEWLGVAVD